MIPIIIITEIRCCDKVIFVNSIVKCFQLFRFELTQLSNCYPANIYLFKVKNRNTTKRYEICSKLTIKTPERRHLRRSGVFIVNF